MSLCVRDDFCRFSFCLAIHVANIFLLLLTSPSNAETKRHSPDSPVTRWTKLVWTFTNSMREWCFFKMAQSRPLLFIFVFFKFLWQIYDLNYIKHRWCALDSNPGGRIEGADEYTELWRHPKSVCCLADWEASLKKCQWAIGTPLKSISVEFYFSRIVFSDSKLVRINWTRVRNYS